MTRLHVGVSLALALGGCAVDMPVGEMSPIDAEISFDSVSQDSVTDTTPGDVGGVDVCGDDLCSPDETCSACPEDCGPCCEPDCAGKSCGDDGCDGSCGECADGATCTDGACVVDCVPLPGCGDVTCGELDDGCGGTLGCGECADGSTCTDGACVVDCVPLPGCGDVTCGELEDGCGEVLSCGECADGSTCTDGVCVLDCVPSECGAATCGVLEDGCGGLLACGICGAGICIDGSCCGDATPSGSEGCDDGNNTSGDGCSATCEVEPPIYAGLGSWVQDCFTQSDAAQDALMDAICVDDFGAMARAATTDELVSGAITTNWPITGEQWQLTNHSGNKLMLKCPNCAGTNPIGGSCVSSHARKCVDVQAPWPTSLDSGWQEDCLNGVRSTLCVW